MTAQERFCKRTAPRLEARAWAFRMGGMPEPGEGLQPEQNVHLYLCSKNDKWFNLVVAMTPEEARELSRQLLSAAW